MKPSGAPAKELGNSVASPWDFLTGQISLVTSTLKQSLRKHIFIERRCHFNLTTEAGRGYVHLNNTVLPSLLGRFVTDEPKTHP